MGSLIYELKKKGWCDVSSNLRVRTCYLSASSPPIQNCFAFWAPISVAPLF